MYFGIIGDHHELALQGLTFVHAQQITHHGKHLITFHSDYPERLNYCAPLIKRGSLTTIEKLYNKSLPDTVGVSNKNL